MNLKQELAKAIELFESVNPAYAFGYLSNAVANYLKTDPRENMKTFSGWCIHYGVDKDNMRKKAKRAGISLGIEIGKNHIITREEAESFFGEIE